MIQCLIKMLEKNGFKIIKRERSELEYIYCFLGDKIYFFTLMNDSESTDYLQDLAINISQVLDKDGYKSFFIDEGIFSEKDIETNILDLRTFLWDLYIIGIHICSAKNAFSMEYKSIVERDKVIAKKIIIEEINIIKAADKIIQELTPSIEFDSIFNNFDKSTNENNLVNSLLNIHLTSDSVVKEDPGIKERILGSKEKEQLSLEDIITYLSKIKTKCSDFKMPIE